jgi:colicin import membrane protein
MLKKRGMLSLLCVLVVFSFALVMGCAQPPTEEMAKADKAVADAKAKEADVYAAEAFKKAEDAFKKAKDQVAAKKYKEAKQAAVDAASLAQQAVAGVEAGKAKMKEDAAKIADDVAKNLDELKNSVAAALKKKLAVPKEEVQAAIGKWSVDLAMAKDKLQGEKISEAFGELNAMMTAVGAKKDEIAKLIASAPATPEKKKK